MMKRVHLATSKTSIGNNNTENDKNKKKLKIERYWMISLTHKSGKYTVAFASAAYASAMSLAF